MKEIEIRKEIASAIIALSWSDKEYDLLNQTRLDIQWCWDNWEDECLKEFYEGEKPEDPTEAFIKDFCYNEDFAVSFGKEREQDLIEWFAE